MTTLEKKYNYTYSIYDTINDMYYIGSTGQKTQSQFKTYIRAKSKHWNIKNYKTVVMRMFDTRLEACQYEVRVQLANDVVNSDNYYNTRIDRILDYKWSIESKEKLKSNHHKCSGKHNAMYGKTHTQETKDIISKVNKGRKHSNEVNASKGRKGMKHKMINSLKGTTNLATSKEIMTPDGLFPSSKKAAEYYGITAESMRKRIKRYPGEYYYT